MTLSVNHSHSSTRHDCSPYGVLAFVAWNHDWNDHHFKYPNDIELAAQRMQDAGIHWVRMDFLWADIEPEPGRHDFERYDGIVAILRKHKLCILGVLEYNPL